MIELIFAIVIIGILVAVAVPKLAATKDDAEAAVCVQEVRQLIDEISAYYIKAGSPEFENTNITDMTNLTLKKRDTKKGFSLDGKVDGRGVIYECGGAGIVTFSGKFNDEDNSYDLKVKVWDGYTPISNKAIDLIKKNILDGNKTKVFKL